MVRKSPDQSPIASKGRPLPREQIVRPRGAIQRVGGEEEFRFHNGSSVQLACHEKTKNSGTSQLPLLVDRPPNFAHLLAGLDPLLDSGEGGAGAVLEGEESILDESDGSHFDRMVGVCVLVNFLKSDECAKGVGIFVSVFNAV